MRGTATSGPYDWWLIGDIRLTEEMSAVSTAASASRSNVRQPAAVYPAGQETGAGGVALLRNSSAELGGVIDRLPSCEYGKYVDRTYARPSDPDAGLPPRLIPRYEYVC